jgi:methionyl-tRNA formyltransferase
MQILVFGIYQIGIQALTGLCRQEKKIVAVVTKPDTAEERQPVAAWAARHGIVVLQPSSPKDADFLAEIRRLRPDLIIVAGYHKVIPQTVLELPPRGVINVHGSLLPKYRGPCTWKWALINGESQTGVTIHAMTAELDRGDIFAQRPIPIAPDDTGGSLFQKICDAGGELLAETIDALEQRQIVPKPQDESEATYYGNFTEEYTRICWHSHAERIRDLVRGLNPRPGAWTTVGQQRLGIGKLVVTDRLSTRHPGEIVECLPNGLHVATGSRDVALIDIGIDGSPAEPWQAVQPRLNSYCGVRLV